MGTFEVFRSTALRDRYDLARLSFPRSFRHRDRFRMHTGAATAHPCYKGGEEQARLEAKRPHVVAPASRRQSRRHLALAWACEDARRSIVHIISSSRFL